jgi:hypothetical protein
MFALLRTTPVFVVSIVVAAFIGINPGNGFVLCMGSHGHIAIETQHDSACPASQECGEAYHFDSDECGCCHEETHSHECFDLDLPSSLFTSLDGPCGCNDGMPCICSMHPSDWQYNNQDLPGLLFEPFNRHGPPDLTVKCISSVVILI